MNASASAVAPVRGSSPEVAFPICIDGVAVMPLIVVEVLREGSSVVEGAGDEVVLVDVVETLVELLVVVVGSSWHVSTPSVVGPSPDVTPYGFGGIDHTGVNRQAIGPELIVNVEMSASDSFVVPTRCAGNDTATPPI